MAHFQENRFFGLSSRTFVVTLGIIGVVVGLFFIPKMIQTKWGSSAKSSSTATTVASNQAKAKEVASDQRAAIAPNALKGLVSDIDGSNKLSDKKQESKKGSGARSAEGDNGAGSASGEKAGIFSGWNVKVRARGNTDGNQELPKGVTLDTLGTKDASAFFRRSKGDITRFLDRNRLKQAPVKMAIEPLVSTVDQVAAGLGKNVDPLEVAKQLVLNHQQVLQGFSAAGLDRGMLLEWLDIPLIRMIDTSKGGNYGVRLFNSFLPRISLRNVAIKEREDRSGSVIGTAQMNAEIAIKGTDVEAVTVFHEGQPVREVRLGRPDAQGFRIFRINGDAQGSWAFQAHDRFGAQPLTKVYSFYPRVRRFRRLDDGSYDIAFLPRSARNSLDKYFAVAISSQASKQSSDPSVTIF